MVLCPWTYFPSHIPHHPEAAGLMPFEDSVTALARQQYLTGPGQGSPEGEHALCQCPARAVSPIAKNQGVEMGVAPLTVTPTDPLAKHVLPAPMTLYSRSDSLDTLFPKGGMLPQGDTMVIPLNWKLRRPPSSFGLLMPLNEQGKRGVTCWLG